MEQARAAELRRSTAIRVAVSVALAAGLTCLAIVASWGPFESRTDIVGYPAFAAFNVQNYLTAYYLVVGFFPVAALLLFLGLTRAGPGIGLAAPRPRGRIRSHTPLPDAGSPLDGDPPIAGAPEERRRATRAGRIGFVGALLGLEAGIAADSVWLGLVLGTAAYALVVVLLARLLGRSGRSDRSLDERLAAVNALGVPLAVAGLVLVSSVTGVRVTADDSTAHYPWFPAWLGLPAAAALVAVVATALRRAAGRTLAVERSALLLIAAPVCLFLLTATLHGDAPGVYGDAAAVDLFHSGEQLIGAKLVTDGWLPWRDVVLTHGLLSDVGGPIVGQAIFGDSRWGNVAGLTMILHPLYLVAFYFLCVYLFGRNWLFLLLTGLLSVGTWLGPEIPVLAGENFRFLLWPLVLLALAAVLNRPTVARSVGLAFLVVGQALVTPEAAPTAIAIPLVLLLFEWYWRRPGTSIASAFPRSLWFAGAGIGFAGLCALYLASRGALDDFVYVNTAMVEGHLLKGGIPPATSLAPDLMYYFAALAPPAAILISFAYAVARLRLRLAFRTEDWVMAAVAISVLLYYPKFIARMDFVHLLQPYSLALPLILFIAYRTLAAGEDAIRCRAPGSLALRITAHPLSLTLVALVATLASYQLSNRVADAGAYRPEIAERPRLERLGYQDDFDLVAYRDLKRVIDAYLDPGDRLFDFTNEPALFFYLIERDPSTRWFTAVLTLTAETQEDQIRRLRHSRPKLVVFDATTINGLSSWDGIPTMVRDYEVSHWILDRYRPLLTTHAHTIYLRRDLAPIATERLNLEQRPITNEVEFQTQRCRWGKAPNFLSGPALPPADAAAVRARVGSLTARKTRLQPPPGSRWSDYRWLELKAGGAGFSDAEFLLYDRPPLSALGRQVQFQTLVDSPRRYVVPVANCAQWRGYRGALHLDSDSPQDIAAVRLIR